MLDPIAHLRPYSRASQASTKSGQAHPTQTITVALAAADFDSATFVDQYAEHLSQISANVVIYASEEDRVLNLSGSGLVNGSPRVGTGPPSVISVSGIDYVDATGVTGKTFGHTYITDRWIAQDLRTIFTSMLDIEREGWPRLVTRRGLEERSGKAATYFAFRRGNVD